MIDYDELGDILYINICDPYPEQDSEEIEENIIARLNPVTDKIENLEILFFSKRLHHQQTLNLPLIADLQRAIPT